MGLIIVFKQNKPLTNLILGVNLYYQNQKTLDPEIGISLGLLVTFITIGLRLESKNVT